MASSVPQKRRGFTSRSSVLPLLAARWNPTLAVTQQKVTSSNRHDPTRLNCVPDTGVEETWSNCWIFSLSVLTDDDAVRVKRTLLSEQEASGDSFRTQDLLRLQPMRRRGTVTLKTKNEPAQMGQREPTSPNQKEIPMCSRISQKNPDCEECRMIQTTIARCKHRPLRRADGIPPSCTLGELITAGHKILKLDDASNTGTHSSCKTDTRNGHKVSLRGVKFYGRNSI